MVTVSAALLSSRRASTRARSASALASDTGAGFRLRGPADDAVWDRDCLLLMRFRGGRRTAFAEPPVRPDRFTFKGFNSGRGRAFGASAARSKTNSISVRA